MPIDPRIALGVQPVQLENPMNMLAQAMQIKSSQNQDTLAQYSLGKAQRQDSETNALATLLKDPTLDISTPQGQAKVYSAAPLTGSSFIKGILENQNVQSQIGERKSNSAKNDADTALKTIAQHRDQLGMVTNPQAAEQWTRAQYNDPVVGPILSRGMPLEAAIQSIPQDPQGFERWRQQQALGMTKYMELNKPSVHVQNTGNASNIVSTPGLGGAPTTLSSTPMQATPGEVLTDARTRQEGALNRGQAKALHDDTVKNENLRAGVGPGGALDDNAERTAQGIASGQLPAPTGMALLNPKNQRILGRVMEINPQYDATTTAAKRAAAVAFATGKEGAMMRSLQVAGQHLEQLDGLIDAMNNRDTQLVNRLGNAYSQQTGSPAITNFDAAKEVVAKEVMKAIVAGGGGVGEREELARSLANAKSPAQLKGVTQQYRNLMAAQHDALLQQRDAAGLPRSTLPNYTEQHVPAPTAAAGLPAGWSVKAH